MVVNNAEVTEIAGDYIDPTATQEPSVINQTQLMGKKE